MKQFDTLLTQYRHTEHLYEEVFDNFENSDICFLLAFKLLHAKVHVYLT